MTNEQLQEIKTESKDGWFLHPTKAVELIAEVERLKAAEDMAQEMAEAVQRGGILTMPLPEPKPKYVTTRDWVNMADRKPSWPMHAQVQTRGGTHWIAHWRDGGWWTWDESGLFHLAGVTRWAEIVLTEDEPR